MRIAVRQILLAILAVGAVPAVAAQSLLYRPPNLGGTWVPPGGVLQFNFMHRFFVASSAGNNKVTTMRGSVLLEGNFDWGGRPWYWDSGYLYNRLETDKTSTGDLTLKNVQLASGPSFFNTATGRVECGTPGSPIAYGSGAGQCVPWNPLAPYGSGQPGTLADVPADYTGPALILVAARVGTTRLIDNADLVFAPLRSLADAAHETGPGDILSEAARPGAAGPETAGPESAVPETAVPETMVPRDAAPEGPAPTPAVV